MIWLLVEGVSSWKSMTAPDSRFKLPLTFIMPKPIARGQFPLGVTVMLLK